MNHKYYRMDTLRACLTNAYLFLYIPNESFKVCSVDKNADVIKILKGCLEITREEFEKDLPSRDLTETLNKAIYLATYSNTK